MFSCYLKLERRQSVKKDGTESKTPRYEVTVRTGYFKPLESVKNAKGEIVMYWQRNDKCNPNSKSETRLQCKDSINFSSIYLDSLKHGEMSIGYGEPPAEKMLAPVKRKNRKGDVKTVERENPFYDNRNDGYLFILTGDGIPETIEIMVVPDARYYIKGIARELADGQFDDALKQMRGQAK